MIKINFESKHPIFNCEKWETEAYFNCWQRYMRLVYVSVFQTFKGEFCKIEISLPENINNKNIEKIKKELYKKILLAEKMFSTTRC